MKAAKNWFKWFDRMVWVMILFTVIHVFVQKDWSLVLERTSFYFTVACLFISLFSYYEYLLNRRLENYYEIEIGYYKAIRDNNGKKIKYGDSLFKMSMQVQREDIITTFTSLSNLNSSLKKAIDAKLKSSNMKDLLCNGVLSIEEVNFVGQEYVYND